MFRAIIPAVLASCLFVGPGHAADPPIFQPGAPGSAARTVTPDESISLAGSRYTADDVAFMQHMIVHHGQAVDMGDLIAERTDNRDIALMGDRIARSQASEMEMMRAWLVRRGLPTAMSHAPAGHAMATGHGGHQGAHGAPSDVPLMAGMLSPAQMAELAAARGDAFDRLYLTGMIHHHQGAIDMVDRLLADAGDGEDPQLSEFLSAVIADQSAEIARMRGLLAGL
ncbi:hypothetical protein AWH62_14495 [Maricaulis sp. W15]|uniref:DUF305 domain-containing protein n=1 Tax=Maricaulis sp. W15 TaxID=1772333 RepID=UPI000948FDE9|nr:DUF305 domain-containing protein [Maricaulis sp. W15]OLF80707.1 hypothetical protein AWH62_14495 [Maricaulis sp. W15]